jgi:hypothetical protein
MPAWSHHISSGSLHRATSPARSAVSGVSPGHSGANSAGSDRSGHPYRWFAPYRLIYFENGWYLVGESHQQVQVFLLESITDVCLTRRQFLRKRRIDMLTGDHTSSIPYPTSSTFAPCWQKR